MPGARSAVAMTEAEVAAFLAEQRTLTCATNDPRGWPHLMPLWYVVRDGECWAWTFGKSQKVRNLERDPRATIAVEAGEAYDELRGVQIRCTVEISRDLAVVSALGDELAERYGAVSGLAGAAREKQAPKRVALRFVPGHVASWDHRKLAAR